MLKKTAIVFMILCAVSIALWYEQKYYVDTASCTFYKYPEIRIMHLNLSRSECSLISLDKGSGTITLALDIRSGKLVPHQRKRSEVWIALSLEKTYRSVEAQDNRSSHAAEPPFPDRDRESFIYMGKDNEVVVVTPFLSGWAANRQYGQRVLRYSYGYEVAPIRYVDALVLSFLFKIR